MEGNWWMYVARKPMMYAYRHYAQWAQWTADEEIKE